MSKTTKRLGRGLDSLVSDLRPDSRAAIGPQPYRRETVPGEPTHAQTLMVGLDDLVPNRFQPRERIPDASLISLAESLRLSGMIQPISARRTGEKYEIIAGERRWRAAKLAGIATVPVVVRVADDREMLELALIENIQREDLNPIERARAYRQYCDRFGLTADEVASRLAEDRSTCANYMRLLDLEEDIQGLVAEGRLKMGHARCIVGVDDPDARQRLAKAVVAHDLSVRALEGIVRRERGSRGGERVTPGERAPRSAHLRDLEEGLSAATGTKVAIQEGRRKGTGRLVIEYYSLDDFERIASLLGLSPEK